MHGREAEDHATGDGGGRVDQPEQLLADDETLAQHVVDDDGEPLGAGQVGRERRDEFVLDAQRVGADQHDLVAEYRRLDLAADHIDEGVDRDRAVGAIEIDHRARVVVGGDPYGPKPDPFLEHHLDIVGLDAERHARRLHGDRWIDATLVFQHRILVACGAVRLAADVDVTAARRLFGDAVHGRQQAVGSKREARARIAP